MEYHYRLSSEAEFHTRHDKEYELRQIDADFWKQLKQGKYENPEFVVPRIEESFESFEDFERKSVGYCAVRGKRIASTALGTARYQQWIPIDIETMEQNRQKGLGYEVAEALILEAKRRKIEPQWDCMSSNLASRSLAERLGFERVGENMIYWFKIR